MICARSRCSLAYSFVVLLAAFSLPAQTLARRAPHAGIDVVDYDLTLDLPERGRMIDGRAVLTVRRTVPADTLRLDLLVLRVDSVLVNEKSVAFRRDSATLRVPLPAGSGDTLRVTVRYNGEPADGLIIRTDSLGRWTAFGDNFPDRGRNWIPSIDDPGDKATVTWTVRAPAGRRVVANGVLQEETPIGGAGGEGRTLTRWRESRPIPVYLMVIAAAPLAYYDLGRTACGLSELPGCVPQSVYTAPEQRDYLPGPFAEAGGIVEFYSRLVGPFPYEKLAHLQSSTRFGGMENASAIFYSDGAFRRQTMSASLIAHETAHQWFGDAVTETEWAHLWLSEGFASYFAELYRRHTAGDSAFRRAMADIRAQVINDSVITAHRPVIDSAQTDLLKLLNTNSYQKGAWVLHMLRREVGDSAFFRGLRSYVATYRHGNALTDDLRREIERASGKDLAWFFDQWLRRPGYPVLQPTWRYDASHRRVIVEIVQGPRFAPFRFPLTVEATDANGVARRATVQVAAQPTQRITIPLALNAAPRSITFDPDVDLLAAFPPQ